MREMRYVVMSILVIGWTSVVYGDRQDKTVSDTFTDNLRPRFIVGEEMPRYSLKQRMAHYGVPGVAVAVIKDGKVISSEGYGVLQVGGKEHVNADSLFSVGSVSKVATAALLLKMHAGKEIDIDAPITASLVSWELPSSDYGSGKDVTLRAIMSHTAGFNIHGFGDFQPNQTLPTVYDTLAGKSPARHDALSLIFAPGTQYKYSGGGYTLAQLIVADVSGMSFEKTAKEKLLLPLGMTRSTFQNPLPTSVKNVAKAHNRDGEAVALPRGYEAMPEMAASGLWTSANELGQLVVGLIDSYRKPKGFLPQNLSQDMMTKVSPSQHGLGPRLSGTASRRFFHHAGANNSYKAWIEGHLVTGDGLVVLTNGSNGDQLFLEIRNAVADSYQWEVNQSVLIPKITVSPELLSGFSGVYQSDGAFPLELRETMVRGFYDSPIAINSKDGELTVTRVGGENTYPLIPTATNRFLFPLLRQREGIAELVFHRDGSSSAVSMTIETSGARVYFKREPE